MARLVTSSIRGLSLIAALLASAACTPASREAASTTSSAAATAATSSFLLGGIQVNEATLEGWLDALQDAGMNTVAVTDYAHHGDWDSENLWWDPNPDLLVEIRGAKARGMHVTLVLRVALDRVFPRNRFLWHGMIMPKTEDQVRRWFGRYQTFVRYWAEIAEAEGIDALMIGSELNALASTLPVETVPNLEEWFLDDEKQADRRRHEVTLAEKVSSEHLWLNSEEPWTDVGTYLDARISAERRWASMLAAGDPSRVVARINRRREILEGHWLELIDCVRGIYRGQLGFAANFDQYHEVSFWDRLDVIGINAYFKLRDYLLPAGDYEALAFALDQGWRTVLGDIDAFRKLQGLEQPVMFTEMGPTTRRNSTIETWADTGFAEVRIGPDASDQETELVVWREQPIDLEERALAVSGLERARRGIDFPLRGILWWKLSSHAYHRDNEAFLVLIGQSGDDEAAGANPPPARQEDPVLEVLRRFHTPRSPTTRSPTTGTP